MSATLTLEPYRLPAGILAAAVHAAFFALLYFGFSWQAFPPAMMSVELWQSLPDDVAAPPAKPVAQESVMPVQPEKAAVKPDIALQEKKKAEAKPAVPKPNIKKIEAKPAVQKPVEQKSVEPNSAARIAEQQAAREQSEKAAAIGRVVDEYKAKIMAKIRSNIVMPPNVAKDVRAEFSVTVLPGGSVLPPKLIKSSGNEAYDNAVERAILKSAPLPLPPDVTLFNRFRELNLVFKPTE
jgi:colicin import membrane protein